MPDDKATVITTKALVVCPSCDFKVRGIVRDREAQPQYGIPALRRTTYDPHVFGLARTMCGASNRTYQEEIA